MNLISKTQDDKGRNVYKMGNITVTMNEYCANFYTAFGNTHNIDGRYGTVAVVDGLSKVPHEIDAKDDMIEKILMDYRGAELSLIAARANVVESVRGYWKDLQTTNTDADHKIQQIKAGQTNKVKSDIDFWAHNWIGIDTEKPGDWNSDEV